MRYHRRWEGAGARPAPRSGGTAGVSILSLRRAVVGLVAAVALAAAIPAGPASAGPASGASARTAVVVSTLTGADMAGAAAEVARLGGTVDRALPIVNGFAARVPAGA